MFPTQVAISPTSVIHYTPEWFGRLEHSMHMAHVASVRIDTNLMFSDVYIETTGGASPIKCHGHKKADAVKMKELIERYQTEYYRGNGQPRLTWPGTELNRNCNRPCGSRHERPIMRLVAILWMI